MHRQRRFAFMQALTRAKDAPLKLVIACEKKGYGYAARVSLESKPGGPWSQQWLMKMLGLKSKGYMSRILNDRRESPMPEWMLHPIAALTGSRLILQHHENMRAKRELTEAETIHRLAAMLREAA